MSQAEEHAARRAHQCMRCHSEPTLYAQETANGVRGLYWCDTCDKAAFGGSSSIALGEKQKLALPRREAGKKACRVCKKVAVLELHHLAPRSIFGDDCDNWPTVEVCYECHREWHEKTGLGR